MSDITVNLADIARVVTVNPDGSITVPANTLGTTPNVGDNTSKLATTGFVLANALQKTGDTLSGPLNEAQGTNVASANTVNLTTATGNYIHITGTATISTITLAQGASRTVVFDGSLTLTNGANLILPSGANIVTTGGDVAEFRGEAGGVVRCVRYLSVTGKALLSLTQGTAQNTTSGTSISFVGIPSWVKRVTILGVGVSTSGTSPLQAQLGAGSIDATATYNGAQATAVSASTGATASTSATGFFIETASASLTAASVRQLRIVFENVTGNTWMASASSGASTTYMVTYIGSKSLSGTLDRIVISAQNGTDSFDAGVIGLIYE